MCGLAGLIDTSARRRDELCLAASAMAEAVRLRGPDDAGAWADETSGVALAFRRLAIIDLSQAGHQPMSSHDGTLVLVFNGEIYNHEELRAEIDGAGSVRWSGHSDTETLLACFSLWGVRKTLERTVGMFALALWNRRERRLYLARDRFGEKPMYYGWTRNAFIFGSELGALRQYPGFNNEIDRDVLALYMQYACVPAPYSIYKNIYKLEPGCLLTRSDSQYSAAPSRVMFAPAHEGDVVLERYWSLPDVIARERNNPLEPEVTAIDRLESMLINAVRLQSIADVPLGAFLSGGIDSSLIVALMKAQSSHVRTFTIGFDESGFNEATHAKAVARHLGTEHTELYLSPQEARDVIPLLPGMYSEPFADSSQIPTHLVSRIARRNVTVALSGDGGDELFGGYTRYIWGPRIWAGLRRVPRPVRRAIGAMLQDVPIAAFDRLGNVLPPRFRVARAGDKAHKLGYRLRHADSVDDLYRVLVSMWPADAGVVRGARPLHTSLDAAGSAHLVSDAAQRMMLWDTLTYLPDDILHKVDRASMSVSLETRAPFLDHRIAEFAWRLPVQMKIRDGKGKWILRQLLYRYVPKELVERPKMGFGVPINEWIRGPMRAWAEDLLDEATLQAQGYFNTAAIRQKWTEHLSGTRNWQNELWCVLMFQAWLAAER